MTLKIKKNDFLMGVFFIWMLFNSAIAVHIKMFNYLDEGLFLFSILFLIIEILKKSQPIKKRYLFVAIMLFIIILIGFISDLIWDYNANWIVVIKDIVAFSKMPVIFIAFSYINDRDDNTHRLDVAYVCSKICILIMSACAIVSMFKDIGMSYDIRKGILSYKFIFLHPTFMVYALAVMLSVLVAHGIKKGDYVYHALCIFMLILSMRDKAFAFVILYFLILFIIPNAKKLKVRYVIMAFLGAFLVSYKKIIEYFNFSWSPREALYVTGIEIANRCFPFGSGLGTFASNLSGEYYSKVYELYDTFNKPGVSPNDYVDLGDAGFSYYYAQFGWIGLLLFILILIAIYVVIKNNCMNQPDRRHACFMFYGYLVISLLVETVFINETGATSMVFMFYYMCAKGTTKYDTSIAGKNKVVESKEGI